MNRTTLALLLSAVGLALALTFAPARTSAAPAPAAASTQPTTQPSAQDVINELMSKRRENPLIEPTRRATINPVTTTAPAIDRNLMGTAPGLSGGEAPKLRPEGEVVVNRRARLVHVSSGTQWVLVFEGDGEYSPEAPMFLLPCLMLQEREVTVAERGDKAVFLVSGQVYQYRGANYLLPTMMMLAPDKDNLKH